MNESTSFMMDLISTTFTTQSRAAYKRDFVVFETNLKSFLQRSINPFNSTCF